jgi:hypothetical protein
MNANTPKTSTKQAPFSSCVKYLSKLLRLSRYSKNNHSFNCFAFPYTTMGNDEPSF